MKLLYEAFSATHKHIFSEDIVKLIFGIRKDIMLWEEFSCFLSADFIATVNRLLVVVQLSALYPALLLPLVSKLEP